MKQLGWKEQYYSLPEWDASPFQGTPPPPPQFAGIHFYSRLERGTVGEKCFAYEHNTMTQPGSEP